MSSEPVLHHDQLREALREAGLRCTVARLEVYRVLVAAGAPITHKDAGEALPELDRITVFRNLVALVDAGLALRVDLGDRVWRYTVPGVVDGSVRQPHPHPHFTCTTCGEVTCLDDVRLVGDGADAPLLEGAEVHVRGRCGTCR